MFTLALCQNSILIFNYVLSIYHVFTSHKIKALFCVGKLEGINSCEQPD